MPSSSLFTKTAGVLGITGLSAAAISNELYVGVYLWIGDWGKVGQRARARGLRRVMGRKKMR